MQHSFEQLMDMLVSRLEAAPACASREQAFEQVQSLWLQTHLYFASPEAELRRIRSRRMTESHGWKDLDRDPCYLDPDSGPEVRLYLHRDGSMVIQRMRNGSSQIIFSRLGLQLQA
ncbi:hypothetical protein [Delftia sp. PS-11]|uniref:hypothetical protein n=1 Tax=Delftia sp. PS-11 TaxID=2767222 RepID=UPI00245851F2|nr:hypothetical protein [Delftia sp. PS-11]KAJ8741635.1 hypothetical protein H9T68_21625 [Delftia sp. PS-11]